MAQKIIVASGIEIRDFQGSALPTFLNANADAGKGSVWTFPKGAGAKADFEVTVVFTMAEFKSALEADGAWVIYEGHSRYGQGPAFGDPNVGHVPDVKKYPANPWGIHFRMGYDATDTECVGDLLEHSVKPAEYDLPASPPKAFLPNALKSAAKRAQEVEDRRKKKKLTKIEVKAPCSIRGAWRSLDVCDATLADTETSRKERPLKGRHYYAFKPGPPKEYLTAVQVGSADLDKSPLKCAVLFMASCSSQVHFLEPLANRRKAVKSKCKFYMTAQVCSAFHARTFLQQVFKKHDPVSKRGSKVILKALNGERDSGSVGIY